MSTIINMLKLVLLLIFTVVDCKCSGIPAKGCKGYDIPEFSSLVEDQQDFKKYECLEGYKMTVSITCGRGKWNEIVQCVQEEVDFCEPNPCLNNGICQNGQNSFTCDCVGLWEGDNCGSCSSFILSNNQLISENPNIGFTNDNTAPECETSCANDPECNSYSFYATSATVTQCALYSSPLSQLTLLSLNGATSGEKNC